MFGTSKTNLQKQPTDNRQMDNRGSSSETNRLAEDINVGNKRIQKIQKQPQLQKMPIKNDGPAASVIKKMSLTEMIASANRLSKNLERKMTKPVIKKENRMNVNDKQIKRVPLIMCATPVPRRSVFEVTKTRLLVPLTPEPARLQHQCIREENVTIYMPLNKKHVAVQTVSQNDTIDTQKMNKSNWCDLDTIGPTAIKCSPFQQQPVEMGFVEEKTQNNEIPFKYIVKKFDKFLRKNMKATNLYKENRDKLTAQRIVVAATNHNHWKHFMYFSSFTIGVITTCVVNYGWHYFRCTENSPLLLL